MARGHGRDACKSRGGDCCWVVGHRFIGHWWRCWKGSALHARLFPGLAEYIVGTDVAILVLVGIAWVCPTPFLLQIEQLAFLVLVEVTDVSKLTREHQNTAVSIENLGPPIGLFDIDTETDRPVVGQDDDVGLIDKRQDRVGEGLSTRGLVSGDRNIP